ncbi:MAG: hypothetical protein HFI66_09165 [Lachnospiraceae bacterium]|nr:hypothetical protein [Lachnospiraceae bacterium]
MEQMDLKATELDKMTCSYDLQMVKAALTYFPPQPKRLLSVLIKVQELKNTLRLVSGVEDAGFLNICSTPESTPKQGFFDIWNEIKDYGSPEQQKMFERLNQAIQLSSMYEQMSKAAPQAAEQTDGQTDDLSPDLTAASLADDLPSSSEKSARKPDFRTCIRNSLSPENQALFDSYSAMFHSPETLSGKET